MLSSVDKNYQFLSLASNHLNLFYNWGYFFPARGVHGKNTTQKVHDSLKNQNGENLFKSRNLLPRIPHCLT